MGGVSSGRRGGNLEHSPSTGTHAPLGAVCDDGGIPSSGLASGWPMIRYYFSTKPIFNPIIGGLQKGVQGFRSPVPSMAMGFLSQSENDTLYLMSKLLNKVLIVIPVF